MKVYQLRILELGFCLEPIYKDIETAMYYKDKYKERNVVIREWILNKQCEYVYRIKNETNSGYTLEDDLYESYVDALSHIKTSSQVIIKERLSV